jgi:hypothetical protein
VRDDYRDDIIGGDLDPGREKPLARSSGQLIGDGESVVGPERIAYYQRAGRTRATQQQAASRDHAELPARVASARTAARIREYVPQRQMFVIAAANSSSVGVELRERRALTAMTIPDWQ